MQIRHRQVRTRPHIRIAARRPAVHVPDRGGIVDIISKRTVAVDEIHRRFAAGAAAGFRIVFEFHPQPRRIRRRVVRLRLLVEKGPQAGGHVGFQHLPGQAAVARQQNPHRRVGLVLAAVPPHPRPVRRRQRRAVHIGQQLQPRIGPALARLGRPAVQPGIQPAAVGIGLDPRHILRRIAQIDRRRSVGIRHHEIHQIGVIATGRAPQVIIAARGVGKQRIRISAPVPAQRRTLQRREFHVAAAHAVGQRQGPDHVVVAGHGLIAEQRGSRLAQNAVRYRQRLVGRRMNDRLAVPHHPVQPLVVSHRRGTAEEGMAGIVRRQAAFEHMAHRRSRQAHARLVVPELHVAQRDVARPAPVQTGAAAGQSQVLDLQKTGPADVQHRCRRHPVENDPVGAAQNPHRTARAARVESSDHHGLPRIGSRVHIHHIAPPQRIVGQDPHQAGLGSVRRHPEVGGGTDRRAINVVGRAAVVHVETECRVGRRAHTERLGIRRGAGRVGGVHHPPQHRRMGKRRRPRIALVRRRQPVRDRAPARPVVCAVFQIHRRPRPQVAPHPFQPSRLDQAAPVIERHGEQPIVFPALARLRRPPVQPDVHPPAVRRRLVRIRLGKSRLRYTQRQTHSQTQPANT